MNFRLLFGAMLLAIATTLPAQIAKVDHSAPPNPLRTTLVVADSIPDSTLDLTSPHAAFAALFSQLQLKNESEYDLVMGISSEARPCTHREIFGFHPYWMGTAYKNYRYNLLSTVAFFAYEVDPVAGIASDMHQWGTSGAVDTALAAGCKVSMTVTNFGKVNNHTLLTNDDAQNALIADLVLQLKSRGATGVTIDFEGVAGSDKGLLTLFMFKLSQAMRDSIADAQISICLPAVDWRDAFDVKAMDDFVDQFIIMGYDYHYSGSSFAGPVAPLNSGKSWPLFNVRESISTYLLAGPSRRKFILAVPYYGHVWKTPGPAFPSDNDGFRSSLTYYELQDAHKGKDFRGYDRDSQSPYYAYAQDDTIYQVWYEDPASLAAKYRLIDSFGIGGVGIWALGYDHGYDDLWDLLDQHFGEPCKQGQVPGGVAAMSDSAGTDSSTAAVASIFGIDIAADENFLAAAFGDYWPLWLALLAMLLCMGILLTNRYARHLVTLYFQYFLGVLAVLIIAGIGLDVTGVLGDMVGELLVICGGTILLGLVVAMVVQEIKFARPKLP